MIISAQFKSQKTGAYGGRKYSYVCDIPGVKPGDYVRVPAGDGESVVLVAEVDVPESSVDVRILPILKSVIAIAEEPQSELGMGK